MRYVVSVFIAVLVAVPVFAHAQTLDIASQISSLTQLIAQLQARMQTTSTASPAARTVTLEQKTGGWSRCLNYPMNIKLGYFDTSGDPGPIKLLQMYLASTGDFSGEPSGYYGSVTQKAMQSWQRQNGVVSSGTPESTGYGVLGPKTREALKAATCTGGSTAVVVPTQTPVLVPVPTQTSPITIAPSYTSCRLGDTYVPSGTSVKAYAKSVVSAYESCEAFAITRTCTGGVLSGNSAYQYASCAGRTNDSCVLGNATLANGESRTFYVVGQVFPGDSCANYAQQRTCVNGVLSGSSQYTILNCQANSGQICQLGGVTVSPGSSRTFYSVLTAPAGTACSSYSQVRSCSNGTLSGSTAFQYASCVEQSAQPVTCSFDGQTLANFATTSAYLVRTVAASDNCSYYSQMRQCINGSMGGNAAYRYASCSPGSGTDCVLDGYLVPSGSSTVFYSTTAPAVGTLCGSYQQTRTCSSGVFSGDAAYNRRTCSDTAACVLGGLAVAHGGSATFYRAASVAYGSSCGAISVTRVCTNGKLSGDDAYAYGSCSVNPPVSLLISESQLASVLDAFRRILDLLR